MRLFVTIFVVPVVICAAIASENQCLAQRIVSLGNLPKAAHFSMATGVSSDGSVIVGGAASADGVEPFRWTQVDGMKGLGDLPGGRVYSTAFSVSADGSVIVGYRRRADADEAFRWRRGGGMQGLGDLPGGFFDSVARGVSADGSVIVGHSQSASQDVILHNDARRFNQSIFRRRLLRSTPLARSNRKSQGCHDEFRFV